MSTFCLITNDEKYNKIIVYNRQNILLKVKHENIYDILQAVFFKGYLYTLCQYNSMEKITDYVIFDEEKITPINIGDYKRRILFIWKE